MEGVFPQFCNTVIAIEPTNFGYNEDAGISNKFMSSSPKKPAEIQKMVFALLGSWLLGKLCKCP